MRASIFVTDDDEVVRSSITRRLSKRQHDVRGFDSGEALLEGLHHDIPDILLLDLNMPGMTGLETLKYVRSNAPHLLVIILTAYGTIEDAVEAMKLGAYDFLIKSIDLSGVGPVIERAIDYLTLRRRVSFETQGSAGRYALKDLIANSPSMRGLVSQVEELSQNAKTTILLQGETGTGKEFIARVLHHNGPRNDSPFVGVNCTAIPQELFESELFGHVKGAFTGANFARKGLIEEADGGTLFMDEINSLHIDMQSKLLRFLQEGEIRPVGGNEVKKVDVRIIAASGRPLLKCVESKEFREDLFYRLYIYPISVPSLSERSEDIPLLANHFLKIKALEQQKRIEMFDGEVLEFFRKRSWHGNIRELENFVEIGRAHV